MLLDLQLSTLQFAQKCDFSVPGDDTNLKQIILRPWPKRQEALDDGTQQTIASNFNHQMYEVLIWIRCNCTLDLKEVIHDWLYYPAMVRMKHRVLYFTKVVDNDRIPCHRLPSLQTLSTQNSAAQVASRVRLYGCRPFSDGRDRRNGTAACERERHGSTWRHA